MPAEAVAPSDRRTLGQAARIDGVTPAALTLVLAHIKAGARLAPCRRIGRIGRTVSALTSSPQLSNVSRETLARLKAYAGLLAEWKHAIIWSPMHRWQDVWRRHFWDSAQLAPLIPAKRGARWSISAAGPGFPAWCWRTASRDSRVPYGALRGHRQEMPLPGSVAERLGLRSKSAMPGSKTPNPSASMSSRPGPGAAAQAARLMHSAFGGTEQLACSSRDKMLEGELTEAHKSWRMKLSNGTPAGPIRPVSSLKSGSCTMSREPRSKPRS